jgi:hypothetical protein
MREQFELSYFDSDLDELLNDEITIEDFLNEVLEVSDPDTETDKMCRALQSYNSQDGGSPDVYHFEISEAEFNEDALTGSFLTEFTVYYYYGCDDMNQEEEDYITWKFVIDTDNNVVKFTGEEQLERDPDEY